MEEKGDWIEKAIEYEATPKSLRDPKEKGDFINQLGVPRSTYYREMSKNENVSKMIELCFKQAKFRTPEIIEKMGQKAESGNDASIAQFMEYVLEVKKKLELSGDKNNPLVVEQIRYEDNNSLQIPAEKISDPITKGTPDGPEETGGSVASPEREG